jgi:hypothetical protein
MKQRETIERILRNEGQIDNFLCMNTRLTLRLGAHIFNLRKKGWDIETKELPNRNTVYILKSLPHN